MLKIIETIVCAVIVDALIFDWFGRGWAMIALIVMLFMALAVVIGFLIWAATDDDSTWRGS